MLLRSILTKLFLAFGISAVSFVIADAEISNYLPKIQKYQLNSGHKTENITASSVRGVYSIINVNGNPPQPPIDYSIFSQPVDGVYIELNWADIETQPGVYNYSLLDHLMQLSTQNGKNVILAIRAGDNSPNWIYQPPYNVSNSFFIFSIQDGAGPCENIYVPWPWDSTYQHLFSNMITSISQHLKSNPNSFSHIVMVKITGINTDTDEFHVPSSNGSPGPQCTQSDAQLTWQQVGYTPNKLITAAQFFTSTIANAFPNQLISLAILTFGDFPLISNSGALLNPGDPGIVDIKEALVKQAVQAYPGRFAINITDLTAYPPSSVEHTYASQGAVPGYQVNEFLGLQGAGCNAMTYFNTPSPCTAPEYEALLMNGVQTNGVWLELWPYNVKQYPSDVVAADAALDNHNQSSLPGRPLWAKP